MFTELDLNKSIIKRAVLHMASSCWNHISCKSSSSILGKKSWLSFHGSAYHSQLRYDSQHRRIMVQWCSQPIKRTKLWIFLDALVAFAMLLVDPNSKIDNSAYLHIHWAKNKLRRWIQFSIKNWIFGQLSKSPFIKNSALRVVVRLQFLHQLYFERLHT